MDFALFHIDQLDSLHICEPFLKVAALSDRGKKKQAKGKLLPKKRLNIKSLDRGIVFLDGDGGTAQAAKNTWCRSTIFGNTEASRSNSTACRTHLAHWAQPIRPGITCTVGLCVIHNHRTIQVGRDSWVQLQAPHTTSQNSDHMRESFV